MRTRRRTRLQSRQAAGEDGGGSIRIMRRAAVRAGSLGADERSGTQHWSAAAPVTRTRTFDVNIVCVRNLKQVFSWLALNSHLIVRLLAHEDDVQRARRARREAAQPAPAQ